MSIYEKLIRKEEKLSLVGLGYVGMPIAVAFANKGVDVVGFDLNIAHNNPSPLFRFGISFNKLFDYLAAKKPILADFPCPYNPAVQRGAGRAVENPTAKNIAKVIEQVVTMENESYMKMCENSALAANEYDFKNLTNKLVSIIEEA